MQSGKSSRRWFGGMWSSRTIAEIANSNPQSGLHNPLLTEALLSGYFATQVLAIRRLMDNANKDVISLPRLLKDIHRNLKLFTRENVVGFDGLPYDYAAVQQRVMLQHLGKAAAHFGLHGLRPDACFPAQMAHQKFDRLIGVRPEDRSRSDRLPKRIINELVRWLDKSGADEIVKWSHTLLAHAAGPNSPNRSAIAAAAPTADKITLCIRAFVQVAEAVTNTILGHSGRGMLVTGPAIQSIRRNDQSVSTAASGPSVHGCLSAVCEGAKRISGWN